LRLSSVIKLLSDPFALHPPKYLESWPTTTILKIRRIGQKLDDI